MKPASSRAHGGNAAALRRAACVLIAAVACHAALAEQRDSTLAAPRPALDDVTAPLLERIAAEEARNGPFSRDLIDLLASLGFAYQEYGRHDLARGLLDRAAYLLRFNDGLFSLDQAPLLERLLDGELAAGRSATAAEIEAQLLELARRNLDDLRSVPIFRDAADREVAYYERYLRHELPPVIELSAGGNSSRRSATASVWRARGHYNQAILALARDGGGREHGAELAALEEDLARTYYLEASDRPRWFQGPGDRLYGLGVVSYQRRIGYTTAASPTPLDYARALVELADWSLLFSRNGTALKRYAQAHAVLVDNDVPAAAIEELFPAALPVFLPAFVPSPLDAGQEGATGFVDFKFEINKYGDPRRVRIVDAVGAEAEEIARDIVFAVGSARFRPSPLAEERATEYRLRFSLADGSLLPRP